MKRLGEEVAYLAYHLHWSHDEIMRMDHAERAGWVDEVAALNRRRTEADG